MKVRIVHIRSPRIEMLPLIDVVFLLLVVFIYTMLSMAVHKGMPVALPTSSTAQTDAKTVLSITVTAQGDIFIDKAPVALEALHTVLRQRAAEDKEPGVLLFADRSLPYQQLFRVLDQVRRAGLTRINLQAEPEPLP
ncbi:MAG: biopolymer transporter ExbD [Desulfobacteraceae bacterium]|nr:MAG: biopolymer transporter ExbD [Desulfobacteraceae bacterium]